MNKIESFKIDHTTLNPGIYVSRIDGDITTYDLRFMHPNNKENLYLDNEQMHTFEHLFATYVRNSEISEDIIYFGPMGCQTGFYLLVRNADNSKVLSVVISVLKLIINHKGEVFGCSEIECGNFKTLKLEKAVETAKNYLEILNNKENDFKY